MLPFEENCVLKQPTWELKGYDQLFALSDEQKLEWADILYLNTSPLHSGKLIALGDDVIVKISPSTQDVDEDAVQLQQAMDANIDVCFSCAVFRESMSPTLNVTHVGGKVCLVVMVHAEAIKLRCSPLILAPNFVVRLYVCCGFLVSARRLFESSSNKDVISWTSIVHGHARSERINVAKELFDRMLERNAVSWSAMIIAYPQTGMFRDALEVFNEIQVTGVQPNHAGFVGGLFTCVFLGAWDPGKWVHVHMARYEMVLNWILGTGLMDLYAKCGCIDNVLRVCVKMPEFLVSRYACFNDLYSTKKLSEMVWIGESDLSNGYLDTVIDWIPGMKNIQLRDLPSFIRTTDPNDVALNFLNHVFQKVFKTSAIIINTFDELEHNVLDAMQEMLPPIYAVGPLSLLSDHGSSLWEEDMNCLEWLNGRQPRSVIYVNFGSIAVVTEEHLIEFAWGLVNSEHDFLWIIRQDLVKGHEKSAFVLPEEILREMKGRGLITSWCPQEKVLSHPSVGGFLTHTGWNSTMESISVGMPLLCWPYYGDQTTNCHYACTEWGIGMEIDNDVKRDKVAALIKQLMDGEKGKEMKEKALEWKECAIRATKEGGSSFLNLEKVIKEVLQRNAL
ncbi:hypothetical protein J5N97_016899 [Dioscorea zingiberensis]|uniref:Glycosyltransferase n=1 Tax=Dioscorea zingiberensis TaxID=325984 RepID=A0A9D5CL95_9LILI|nr:hypothetical protein J5N97_016899 [Dioscorea zingiberensis]